MSTAQAAFLALRELATKSLRCARPLPARTGTELQWSGIGFSLLGFQFVIPMGQVAEILELPSFTGLPNVKNWVKGVANIRGRLLPIFDMGEFLGDRLTAHKKVQRILVLDTEILYAGLWVDCVHGMQHFPLNSELKHLPAMLPDSVKAYVNGGFQSNQTPWFIFNPIDLIKDPKFLDVALI